MGRPDTGSGRIATLESPPPREAWEAPPPGGWGSALRGVALGVVGVVTAVALMVADWRLVSMARRMGRHRLHGVQALWHLGLWSVAVALALALAVVAWRNRETLALAFAMLTDRGRLSRTRGRPPVFLDGPPAGALRIAHLSDLHLAEGPSVRLVERPEAAGNQRLEGLLDAPELMDTDLVVITGDITDRGTAAAWRRFFELVDGRGLSDRVVLVPGNHDLGLVEYVEPVGAHDLVERGGARLRPALRVDRHGVVHLANLLKFARAFAGTAGGRRGVVLPPGDTGAAVPFREAFERVEREVGPLIELLPIEPVPPAPWNPLARAAARLHRHHVERIEAARRQLLALFPVAVPLEEHGAVLFVLNTTTTPSRHPATNAFGGVGGAQLRRLERLARLVPLPLRLLALHHHLVRRGEEEGAALADRLFARFGVLADAWRVIRFCDAHHVRAVLNGHRHLSYQLRLPGGTVLLAAPSSTLGDELAGDPRPLFERYDVAATAVAPAVGIYRRVVRPAGTELAASGPAAQAT